MASNLKILFSKKAIDLITKDIAAEKQPYGAGTLGIQVLGENKYPECKWMAMNELAFIQYVKNVQDAKSKAIIRSKSEKILSQKILQQKNMPQKLLQQKSLPQKPLQPKPLQLQRYSYSSKNREKLKIDRKLKWKHKHENINKLIN